MLRLLSPVGTSLFDNASRQDALSGMAAKSLEVVTELSASEAWEERPRHVETVQSSRELREWIRHTEEAAAEMDVASALQRQTGEQLEVRLLATDTAPSRLAAHLIADCASIDGVSFAFTPDRDVIRGLQVRDRRAFETTGMRELVRRLDTLIQERHASNTAISIAGGYKAALPYLSLMGQVYGVPLYYKFEEAQSLLEIPRTPLDADWELFQDYDQELSGLADTLPTDDLTERHRLVERTAPGLVQRVGDELVGLSPMGYVLWARYCTKRIVYYAPDDVETEIDRQPEIQRILRTKFDQFGGEHERGKIEIKEDHRVFDDGNNDNRIYFFREGEKIYIYNTFEDHDAAKEFIDTSFDEADRQDVIERSSRRVRITDTIDH